MCNVTINKCKTCHLRETIEVVGDDADIKREFDRIKQRAERAMGQAQGMLGCRVTKTSSEYTKAQTKTPSAGTDGV